MFYAAVFDRSGKRIADPYSRLQTISNVSIETRYPGGRYGAASFFVKRNPLINWNVKQGYKLQIFHNFVLVYEGEIINIARDRRGTGGNWVHAFGYAETLLGMRTINKPWADDRVQNWIYQAAANPTFEICNFTTHEDHVRFTPKNETWTSGTTVSATWTAPAGQTIKRVKGNYDLTFTGGANDWRLRITATSTGDVLNQNTSNASSFDVDTGSFTASQTLQIDFLNASGGNLTPNSDGTIYGEINNILIYTETSDINMDEIATDIIGELSGDISADTDEISTPSTDLDLLPFVTNGNEPYNSILDRAVALGDGEYNTWAWGVLPSTLSSDNLPKLFLEQFPVLTDWEYELEAGQVPGVMFVEDALMLRNYITVEYRDMEGRVRWVTPDDDANLKDTTSITDYGQRDLPFSISGGSYTQAEAVAFGRKVLASLKDPVLRTSGPVTVRGRIKRKNSGTVPVMNVYAGQRVKFNNITDLLGGAGAVFVIIRTYYQGGALTMELGKPDDLSTFFAQQNYLSGAWVEQPIFRYPPDEGGGIGSGPGGGDLPGQPGAGDGRDLDGGVGGGVDLPGGGSAGGGFDLP